MKIHKCDICLYGQTDKCTNPYGNSGDCFVTQSENTVIEKLIRCDERAIVLERMRNGIAEILKDTAIYNIDCIDTLIESVK